MNGEPTSQNDRPPSRGLFNVRPTFEFEYHGESVGTDMIVLVHGLIGDIVTTWGKFPALLASDPYLPKMDILLCGYRSRLLRWDPEITVVGKRLISELETQIQGDHRLFLVGHSMGGLVILSGLVDACRDGFAQRSPVKNVDWLTLYASPTMGSEAAAAYRFLVRFLQVLPIPTRFLAWFFASRQVRQLARGPYIDTLNREVNQHLYCADVDSGDANRKRFLHVRVVVGDEDRVVAKTSGLGQFHRLPAKLVTGTHKTMKEPEHHHDSRYLALTNDIASCMRETFSKLCSLCLTGDNYAQAVFHDRWQHALRYRLAKAFPDDPDNAERRSSLRAITWRMATANATLTPGQAFDAAMLQVKFTRECIG